MLNELRTTLKEAAMNPRMLMALLGLGGLGAAAAWGIPRAQSAVQGWNTNIGGRNRMLQSYGAGAGAGMPPANTIGGFLPNLRQNAMQQMSGV